MPVLQWLTQEEFILSLASIPVIAHLGVIALMYSWANYGMLAMRIQSAHAKSLKNGMFPSAMARMYRTES